MIKLKVIKGYRKVLEVLSRKSVSIFTADEEKAARDIIDKVRLEGDKALREYTLEYDGVEIDEFEVDADKLNKVCTEINTELLSALELAADRIKDYHSRQKTAIWEAVAKMDGQQLVKPLERVGVYIPGGKACYPSTVLMTVIPARVAGVKEVIVVTPPNKEGKVNPVTLAAAKIAGADKVFRIGGAQAIAALAYGTETVSRVDKICGPGNIYVTMAKKLVYGDVDIDGLQGPSEVVIIADKTADPVWCAADMLAQAEHDTMASSILITDSAELAEKVSKEINSQLGDIGRQEIIRNSLEERGLIVIVDNLDEAIELANAYAPEHLLLLVARTESYMDRIVNAGCIVRGDRATVAIGDYIVGPSHALPTGGTARFGSPLNINDFIKLIDVIDIGEEEVKNLGKAAQEIARAEGLEGHARAIEKRLE